MNQFYTAESVTEGHPDKPVSYTHLRDTHHKVIPRKKPRQKKGEER